MRAHAVLAALLLSLAAIAQPPTDSESLKKRVVELEKEIVALRAENDRLKAVEKRLQAIEKTAPSHVKARPRTRAAGPETMPAMPYDEDLFFLVKKVVDQGRADFTGRTRHTLDIEMIELPPKCRKDLVKVAIRGYVYYELKGGIPNGARRYRVALENLGSADARWWMEALTPRTFDGKTGTPLIHRHVSFARVPTAHTHQKGYDGNSGTVRGFRGTLYWYENSVFFLEDGVLRIIGSVPAREHIRFARELK